MRSKASSQGKHLQTHSSTVVLSLQVQSLQCRVFNKSGQPAKSASYFMSTLHLLFFGNYPPTPPKPEFNVVFVLFKHSRRFAPQCCKYTLKGPDFKIFPPPSISCLWHSQGASSFPFLLTPKLLPPT